jgi:surface antigen
MFYRYAWLTAVLAPLLGCAAPDGELDGLDGVPIGSIRAALDPCGETVPDTRKIDGVPAYAQCATIESGAIYSNNGIDTSATKVDNDWVRTQYSGGYQCTELAHRYLTFKWKVSWIPNGNAGEWCNTMPPSTSGMVQTTTPVHGDLIVFAPSSCGADSTYGHVAVVDVVDAAKGKVTAVEQNQARRGSYNTTCGKCFLHVVANDGTNPGQTIGGGAPAASDAGGKPVVVADAGAAPGKVRPDAAVDSGLRPPVKEGQDGGSSAPVAETGKKTDAGAKDDVGSKADNDDDDTPRAADDDEAAATPTRKAATEGCRVGPSAHGHGFGLVMLVGLAMMLARRTRVARLRTR